MRRSSRLSEKQAKPANEAQRQPRAKKKRLDDTITTIITLDNGTIVEAFKFLNYCQLAKNSLVSKRIWDLIRIHRHRLALLYVDRIEMHSSSIRCSRQRFFAAIEIFDQKLSPEAYKVWVIRNNYLKQIPLEGQVVGKQSAEYGGKVYELSAYCKDSNSCQSSGTAIVFYAETKLNHKHWPIFQHFVRLLMDPFIYIHSMRLIPQKHFINLLAGAIEPNHGRLRCEKFIVSISISKFINDIEPKFISWAKSHMCCDEFQILNYCRANYYEDMVDLFVTGAQCTSAINLLHHDPAKVVVGFVEKFMDLKSNDECQLVESIHGSCEGPKVVEAMKRDYGEFIVKEKRDEYDSSTEHVYEFVNNDVGKKLQLCIEFLKLVQYHEFFRWTFDGLCAADCQCGQVQSGQVQKTCCQQNSCCQEQCCKDGCGPNCKCGGCKCATVRLQRTTAASIRPPQEHPAYKSELQQPFPIYEQDNLAD